MSEPGAPYQYEHDVRPFYKKKRVIIPAAIVALVMVMGIVGAATGDPQPTAAQSSATSEAPSASASADPTTAAATTEAPTTAATTEATIPAPVETTPPPAPTIAAAPVAPVAPVAPQVNFVMPDLVGINLQDAQNAMQQLGVFFTTSTDASGLGRAQIMDNNWIVCGQNFPPGTQMTGDLEGAIDFTVAKIGESC